MAMWSREPSKQGDAENRAQERTANRTLNILASLMFAFPLCAFSINLLNGYLVPALIWFSATQAYYSIRFVDMNVIAKPTRMTTTVFSLAFLAASFTFSIVAIYPDLSNLMGGFFSVAVIFIFFFAFGIRSFWIYLETGKYLHDRHPRMFFETAESGCYNIGMAFFILAFNAFGGLTRSNQLLPTLMFGYYSVVFNLIGVFSIVRAIKFVKQRRVLSKTKEARKLKEKLDNDNWNKVVANESKVGSILSSFLIPLSVASMYLGILGLYLWIVTFDSNYLTAGLLALTWAGTMFAYNLRRAALTRRVFIRIARGLKLTVPDNKELRAQSTLVRNICGTTAGVTFTLGQFISNSGRDSTIADVSGLRITQSTTIYSTMFILLLLFVIAIWIRRYGLSDEECDTYQRRKIASVLNFLLTCFYVITGVITGALAHAFRVPLLIDGLLVAAWVLASFVTRYYLAYLKGSSVSVVKAS